MLHEISLVHEIETPKGVVKQVCEKFLYDAELVAECEAKAFEEVPDCEVVCVCRSKIVEIVNPNKTDGKYYKAKITETSVNEDGNESSRSYQVLCNADDVPEATRIFTEYLKGGLMDMSIDSISKTKIVEIW